MVNVSPMEVAGTMPQLVGVQLSGSSYGTLADFKSTKALDLELSGASTLRGDVEAGDTRLDVSGSSEVTLTGSAQDVTIDASGSSRVDLGDFMVGDASVGASGASTVTVNPSGTLDVDASGGAHVYYLGGPSLGRIETSGGASVEGR